MDNEIKIIREIERKVDNVQLGKEIWNEDRTKLIYNALVCFEDLSRLGTPFALSMGEDVNGLINSRADGIDMLIRWIFKYSKCTLPKLEPNVSGNIYLELGKLLSDDAVKYRAICDSYILWSRDKAEAKIYNNNKGVQFNYLKDDNGNVEIYDLIRGSKKKNKGIHNLDITEKEFKAIDNIVNTIEVDEEQHISYNIDSKDWGIIYNKLSNAISDTWSLPGDWNFGEFTLDEYREFWNVILTKAFIHCLVCMKYGDNGGAVNDCIIIYSKDEIANLLGTYTNLSYQSVRVMIDLITYNEEYYEKKIDVIWSPLISLNGELIAISPNLILTSNPERNLISLINKVDSKSYSRLSVQKEEIMIDEIVKIVNKYDNIVIKNNRPLPGKLPDMDIIMFDTNTNSLLICELKWLLESDSIQEVCERDNDIQKGIFQAKSIQEYAEKNVNDLLNRAYGKNDYIPKISYTCVITMNNIGTSKLNNNGISVIDKEKICQLLLECNGNLEVIINKIKSGSYLNNIQVNYKVIKKDIKYGDNFFRFDACELLDQDIYKSPYKKNNEMKKKKRTISKKSRKINRR